SAIQWSPPRCSTACFIMPSSFRLKAPATACASMPICCPSISAQKLPSNPRPYLRHSNVAVGRPRMETPIISPADHHARQPGELYFAITGEIPRAIDSDRLLDGEVAAKFMSGVLNLPQVQKLLSSEHFSVDGTLIEAWASMKSLVPKDDADPPRQPGG